MTRTTSTSSTRTNSAAALALALCLAAPVAAQDVERSAPWRLVEHVTGSVSEVLLDDEITGVAQRDAVMGLVDETVDFETLSKLVLAKNWKKFDEDQQAAFIEQFKLHLRNTYWKHVEGAAFERIDVVEERQEKRRDWTVMTRVVSGGSAFDIDYRLRQLPDEETASGAVVPGEWKIIDITVEAVSLVANFRSQFQEIVSSEGVEHLLDLLREKNEAAAEAAREEDAAAGGG